MTKSNTKSLPDLETFLTNVNKKDTDHSGKRIRFNFVKRKRKN